MEDLLTITIVIALGFLVAVAFYESLSTRDVIVARVQRIVRRSTRSGWVPAVSYAVCVFVLIPALVLVWAISLDAALFVIGSVELVGSVAFIAVGVVGAARVLAYVREKTSHELAKAIPLALLFVLITGGAVRLDEKLARVDDLNGVNLSDGMLLFLVVLEISLRLLTDSSHWLLARARRHQGIEGDAGVWATVWLTMKRALGTSGLTNDEKVA